MEKRNRSLNWESEEKELLIELMGSFEVLELKKNDTSTNKAKDKAWLELTTRFNELNKIKRTPKQLKGQWKILKMKSHKNVSSLKKSLRGTGGGPAPQPLSQETLSIMQLVPHQFARGTNEFDSDGVWDNEDLPLQVNMSVRQLSPTALEHTVNSVNPNIGIAAVSTATNHFILPITATTTSTPPITSTPAAATTTSTPPITSTPAAATSTSTPPITSTFAATTTSTPPITTTPAATTTSTPPITTAAATPASISTAAATTATPRRIHTNTSGRGSRRTAHPEEYDIRYNTFQAMERYRRLQDERQQKEHELNIERQQKEHELNISHKILENDRLQKEHELRMEVMRQYQKLMNIMEENLNKKK